ncbi:hypothetical protein [Streptomyces sp. NPDC046261]|uniref:DUF7927 domain-containing protein n=1 Tax=Streptomyces sp. NPDC046261 TaxID=3157200 RepID=UPI0033ECC171
MRHHLTRILFSALGLCAVATGGTAVAAGDTPTPATLQIAKTADRSSAHPGDTVHYKVTVTNSGSNPIAGAKITDNLSGVLDDATYNHDAAADAGTTAFSSPDLTWTGDLAPGAKATLTYSVKVSHPATGNKQLSNKVTSDTAGSNCPSGSTDPGCSTSTSVSAG